MITDQQRPNPVLRCPLPPFNSDPDTLRQFEIGSPMPLIRVIPLPPLTGANPVRATAVSASKSSSSSSSVKPTSLTMASVTIDTGVMAVGAEYSTSVQLQSKSYQLLSLTASAMAEVRLYGTASAQAFDLARAVDAPVAPEISQNIVTSVSFDTLPFVWGWQNRIGANQDNPQNLTLYVTILNTDTIDVSNITIVINYQPLEV